MNVGDLNIRITVDGKAAKVNMKDFSKTVNKVSDQVQERSHRMRSGFSKVADMGQKLFFTIQGFGAVIGTLNGLSEATNKLEKAERRLEGAAKLTGQSHAEMLGHAASVKEEFKLTTVQANGFVESLTKLGAKAGDTSQTADAVGRLLNLAAARGYDAEQAMTAIDQAILGIDEGTDKLFGKNPSVIYAEYSKQIGISAGKMNDQQKAQALLNAVMEDGLKVQGSYEDFINSAAGKQALMAGRAEDAAAKLGKMYNKITMILADIALPLLEWFTNLEQGTANFVLVLVGVTAALWKVIPAIKGVSSATKFLGRSVKTALGPLAWIATAIGLLYAAWTNNLFGLKDVTIKIWGYIKASFKAAWEFIKNIGKRYADFYKGLGEIMIGVFTFDKGKIKSGLTTMKGALVKGWGDALKGVKEKYGESLEAYKAANAAKVENSKKTANQIKTIEIKANTAANAAKVEDSKKTANQIKTIEAKTNTATTADHAIAAQRQLQQTDTQIRGQVRLYEFKEVKVKQIQHAIKNDFTLEAKQMDMAAADFVRTFTDSSMNLKDRLLSVFDSIKKRWINNIADMILVNNSFSKGLGSILSFIPGGAAIGGFISGLGRVLGFAGGGEVERPMLAAVGERGPEIIAPRQDFIDVVNGLIGSGNIGAPRDDAVVSRLDKLENAIRDMQFSFSVDGVSLARATENGNKFLTRNDV